MATTSEAMPNNEGIIETETQRQSQLLVEPSKPAEPKPKESVDYQKVADKLGNELGELRAQNRELLNRLDNLQNPPPPTEPVPSFQEEPEAYIQRIVKDAITTQVQPNLEKLHAHATYTQTKEFQESLKGMHEDWSDVVSSDQFQNWVKASNARIRLYGDAQAFDLDAANELLNRYKQDAAKMQQERSSALGAANFVEGGSAMDSGKKTFRASEIQKLLERDPTEYQRWLRTEGYIAYKEGRVIKNF